MTDERWTRESLAAAIVEYAGRDADIRQALRELLEEGRGRKFVADEELFEELAQELRDGDAFEHYRKWAERYATRELADEVEFASEMDAALAGKGVRFL